MANLTTKQQLFVITMEECGELTQICSKVLRHGLKDKKFQELLVEELGDVLCMIRLMCDHNIVNSQQLEARVKVKQEKLKQWSKLVK